MKKIFLFLNLLLNLPIVAQVNIHVTIGGYVDDTVHFGKVFGKKVIREKLIRKHENGTFVISSDKNLAPGIYSIIYRIGNNTNSRYFNFIIDDDNKDFQVYTYGYEPNNPSFTGNTKDNHAFCKFLKSHDSLLNEYKKVKDQWLIFLDETRFNQVVDIEQKINKLIDHTINHSSSKKVSEIAKLLKVDFPVYNGSFVERKAQRQNYLDTKFLTNFKPEDERMWQVPNGIELMDFYCIYSSDAEHTKVSERSKRVLDILREKNPGIYKYYFNYLMNSFPRMSKYYYELVTNTLYEDYIQKGIADFFTQEELLKIRNYIANFDRLKVGNKVQDIRLYKEDNSPYNIYDSKSNYTFLVIWSPDCGHCKKEIPIIKKLYEQYKNKGIQILTLCTKRGDKVKECYDFLKSQNLPPEWINLNDVDGRSNYNTIYDVTSFPLLYILDKDKRIVLKRRGEMEEAELDKFFNNLQ